MNIDYKSPLVITQGGTYTGNYKSSSAGTPAVWIWTSEPVELKDMNIMGAGNCIHYEGGGQATIHGCNILGMSSGDSTMRGRGIYCYKPQYVVIENNYIEQTGGGIMLDHANNDSSTPRVLINKNIIKNVEGRNGNLTLGYEHRAGIQLSSINHIQQGEISWNQITNEAGNSRVEDCISIMNSGGSINSYLRIHDNYIKGAYPFPLTDTGFTGSGITVEGDGSINTFETVSQYVQIWGNQVISTCDAGINVNAGHDIDVQFNTIISSGMYPDGTYSFLFWGGGAIWNGSNLSPDVFKFITYKNNTFGYVRRGINIPFTDRQDVVTVAGSPINIILSDNISLPNPITLDTELGESLKWQQKLNSAGVVLGPDGESGTTSTTTSTSTTMSTQVDMVSAKIGQKIQIKHSPINKIGTPVGFVSGSVIVSILDASIATGAVSSSNQTLINITPLKIGSTKGTISITSYGGKIISKTFIMDITGIPVPDVEATDIKLTFTVTN